MFAMPVHWQNEQYTISLRKGSKHRASYLKRIIGKVVKIYQKGASAILVFIAVICRWSPLYLSPLPVFASSSGSEFDRLRIDYRASVAGARDETSSLQELSLGRDPRWKLIRVAATLTDFPKSVCSFVLKSTFAHS